MVEFTNRREYFRINVNCEIDCRLANNKIYKAKCTNLSADGISFITAQVLQIGDELEITVQPENPITPALRGQAKVIRISALANQTFQIGASMTVLEDD